MFLEKKKKSGVATHLQLMIAVTTIRMKDTKLRKISEENQIKIGWEVSFVQPTVVVYDQLPFNSI